MKHKVLIMVLSVISTSIFAATNEQLQREIKLLQQQAQSLQIQLARLQKKIDAPAIKKNQIVSAKSKHDVQSTRIASTKQNTTKATTDKNEKTSSFHNSPLIVHAKEGPADSISFYPTALLADDQVLTYIAGTPIVTSPYLGDRPAFDGSDYIVNISSINRDIRLMQQRRRLYRAYEQIGYPAPNIPIIALSGKAEPVGMIKGPFRDQSQGDLTLGSSEIDVAAALNSFVEAFVGIAFDESPPMGGGPRVTNSSFDLNLGFVNVGNLDVTPFYFTAGQLYAPYGRYSSSMISSPITMTLARTKTRPFIVGYKSQDITGPYVALYGFTSETTLGNAGVGGANVGYLFNFGNAAGDIGAGIIGSIGDSQGMQQNGSAPFTTFGGFSSITNGNEAVKKIPGINVHANISIDRYSLTAEWVGVTKPFSVQDLSFNGHGARPQAAQLEGGVTFMAFSKPASVALGYQWSKETLALNLPKRRLSGVFNISLWKDTVESIEYRHDVGFNSNQFANGAAPLGLFNDNTIGTGLSSDTLIAQIGVYF